MPLVINKRVQDGVMLGIWEITESVESLLSQLTLTPGEEVIFTRLKGDLRKQHWLGYRLIIKKIINAPKLLDINYSAYGRPIILNHNTRISVSHSGDYAAAMVSYNNKPVGIDIEKIHQRIEKVIHKFLSVAELKEMETDYNIEHMHVCWSAKEAIYKYYHRRALDFRENIILEPFVYQAEGELIGSIILDDFKQRMRLQYERFDGYILVFVKEILDENL